MTHQENATTKGQKSQMSAREEKVVGGKEKKRAKGGKNWKVKLTLAREMDKGKTTWEMEN